MLLKDRFNAIDKDKSGSLDKKEFFEFITPGIFPLSSAPSNGDMNLIFNNIDIDGQGFIEWEEFLDFIILITDDLIDAARTLRDAVFKNKVKDEDISKAIEQYGKKEPRKHSLSKEEFRKFIEFILPKAFDDRDKDKFGTIFNDIDSSDSEGRVVLADLLTFLLGSKSKQVYDDGSVIVDIKLAYTKGEEEKLKDFYYERILSDIPSMKESGIHHISSITSEIELLQKIYKTCLQNILGLPSRGLYSLGTVLSRLFSHYYFLYDIVAKTSLEVVVFRSLHSLIL